MQYGRRGVLANSHTWRRVSLAEWTDEMRAPPPPLPAAPLPEYVFDQLRDQGPEAAGLRRQMAVAFPWRAMLKPRAPGGSARRLACAQALPASSPAQGRTAFQAAQGERAAWDAGWDSGFPAST